jgi:ribosomal protein S18 acetylase RimI-like enzyme
MNNSYYHWRKPEILNRLLCRPALPKDTPEVMELTRTIWEGNDYVPGVWQAWLADQQGLLAVAEYGGRVVGLAKLTQIDKEEWWLEGLRVHPDFEGQRIASHLNDYLMEHWKRNYQGVIRLATGSHRLQVQHLCDRNGFTKIAEFTPFVASVLEGLTLAEQSSIFTTLKESEMQEALQFFQENPAFSWAPSLMDLCWQWASPSTKLFKEFIESKNAWWWRDKTGLLLLSEDREEKLYPLPIISLLACPVDRLVAALQDYRKLAAILGYSKATWVAPLKSGIEDSLSAAGFQRDWELSVYIYEKRIPVGMV